MKKVCLFASVVLISAAVVPARASIVVTQNTNANQLAAALIAGNTGVTITNAVLSGNTNTSGAASSGTYTASANTYNLNGQGIVLSTGNVSDYNTGPNTTGGKTTGYGVAATAAQTALLDPITGVHPHFDVTELTITFDVAANVNKVFFNAVFGSEEYPEFVNSSFIDGFGLFLNGTNIAFVNAKPVNINHPDFAAIAGTELDGVLAPGGNALLTFTGAVGMGSTGNTLKFIISDTSDSSLDSTVYLQSLGQINVAGVPEPATLGMAGMALVIGLGYTRVLRKRATRTATV